MRKKQKDWAKDMAFERMHLLFELADHEFKTHPELSNRLLTGVPATEDLTEPPIGILI